MLKNIKHLGLYFLLAAIFLILSGPALAAVLVDTGPVSDDPNVGGWTIFSSSTNPDRKQYLAGQFSIDSDFTIQSVDLWLKCEISGSSFDIKIREDNSLTPGSPLFSKTFIGCGEFTHHWESFSGLNWELPAGTYCDLPPEN